MLPSIEYLNDKSGENYHLHFVILIGVYTFVIGHLLKMLFASEGRQIENPGGQHEAPPAPPMDTPNVGGPSRPKREHLPQAQRRLNNSQSRLNQELQRLLEDLLGPCEERTPLRLGSTIYEANVKSRTAV